MRNRNSIINLLLDMAFPNQLIFFIRAASVRSGPFGYTGYTGMMHTFTEREVRLIAKLKSMPPQTTLKIAESCPLHSMCVPLPLFRIYKIDDSTFEASWNGHHCTGPKQVFRFEESN
jgi:hypothetical protein